MICGTCFFSLLFFWCTLVKVKEAGRCQLLLAGVAWEASSCGMWLLIVSCGWFGGTGFKDVERSIIEFKLLFTSSVLLLYYAASLSLVCWGGVVLVIKLIFRIFWVWACNYLGSAPIWALSLIKSILLIKKKLGVLKTKVFNCRTWGAFFLFLIFRWQVDSSAHGCRGMVNLLMVKS